MTNEREWPPPLDLVEAIHRRYQEEVVEGMNVCPFARRARETGRVERIILPASVEGPSPLHVASTLEEVVRADPKLEIVLFAFPTPPGHAWQEEAAFDQFLRATREVWEAKSEVPVWYMVAFHPALRAPSDRELTPDALVPLLRRSPDPVIQCVNGVVLDLVRKEAQETSHRRMVEEARARDPELAAMLERTVLPDPTLSADIARTNFERLGDGEGRARLEDMIAEIAAERAAAYPGGHEGSDEGANED